MQLVLNPDQIALRDRCHEAPTTVDEIGNAVEGVLLLNVALRCEGAGKSGTERPFSPEAASALWRTLWEPRIGNMTELGLDVDGSGLHISNDGEDITVTGRSELLQAVDSQETVLLSCEGSGYHQVFEVSLSEPRSSTVVRPAFDPSMCLTETTFSGTPALLRATGDQASQWVSTYRTMRLFLGAAEMLGLAEYCLNATLVYVSDRRQFGGKLAGFQTVRHSCAQAFSELQLARSLVYASVARDSSEGAKDREAAWRAHILVSSIALDVCETAIHLHGGHGLVWESGLHSALRRVWLLRAQEGGPRAAADEVGERLLSLRSEGKERV